MPRHFSSSSSYASTPSLISGSSEPPSPTLSPTRPTRRSAPSFPFPGVHHVGPGPEQDRLRQQFRSRGRGRGRQSPRRRAPRDRPARHIRRPRGMSDGGDVGGDSESDDSEAAEFRRGRGRWRCMTGGTGMWDSSGRPMGRAGGAERQRGGMPGLRSGRRGGRAPRRDSISLKSAGRARGEDFGRSSMGMGGFRAARRGPGMRAAPLPRVRPRTGGGGWTTGFARRRGGIGRGGGRGGGGGGGGRMLSAGSHNSSTSSEWSDCSPSSHASSGAGRLGSWGKAWTLPESRPHYVQEAYHDSPYFMGSRRATGRGGYAYDFERRRPKMRGFAIEEDEGWLEGMWNSWFGGGRSAAFMPWTRWWG